MDHILRVSFEDQMEIYQFRNGFEEGHANIYGIAFQCFLAYTVEVYQIDSWVLATNIETIASLVPNIKPKHPHYHKNNVAYYKDHFLYVSNEIVAKLPLQAVALAIASSPEEVHQINERYWDSTLHHWNSNRKVYEAVYKLLGPNCPPFSYDSYIKATDHNRFGHNGWKRANRMSQIDFWRQDDFEPITNIIKRDLREHGTCQVPYIGTFTLHENRLSFSASRHLKKQIKGKPTPKKHLNQEGAFGGESNPVHSIPLWQHTKHSKLSKRRKFVLRMVQVKAEGLQSVPLANTAYQIFCNALISRLTNGQKFIWPGLGTLHSKKERVYFRKSRIFNLQTKQ